MNIIISTLARYQTKFWIQLAKNLSSNKEIKIIFICFDSESYNLVKNTIFKAFKGWEENNKNNGKILRQIKKLSLDNSVNIDNHFFHERICFNFKKEFLEERLINRFINSEKVLKRYKNDQKKTIIIQELGGYLSNLGLFLSARNNSFDNYFIEPSFFSERFFLIKNTYNCPIFFEDKKPENILIKTKNDHLKKEYIFEFLNKKPVSMPKKDKLKFKNPIFRILSFKNIARVFEKYISTIFLRNHYEFGSISFYIYKSLSQYINSLILSIFYIDLNNSQLNSPKIIYYPMHVPNDLSLTIRERKYFDQLAFCEKILKSIKTKDLLVIKEHPAMKGSLEIFKFIKLKSKYKNFLIIKPSISNYEITSISNMVYTINSKAGFESILQGTRTKVFGNSFYKKFSMSKVKKDLKRKSINLLQQVYKYSSAGNLYSCDFEDIKEMSNSIKDLIKSIN